MKKQLLIITILLLFSLVNAFDYKQFEGIEVPSNLKLIVGSQRVNVFVDDSFLFSFQIKNGVALFNDSEFEKASLEVYTSSSTIERLEKSEDITKDAMDAYNSGEIKIVKKTFMNKVRFFFANFFI